MNPDGDQILKIYRRTAARPSTEQIWHKVGNSPLRPTTHTAPIMGKRSRDASFSPSAEDSSSSPPHTTTTATSPDADVDELPPSKLMSKPAPPPPSPAILCSLPPHHSSPLSFPTHSAFTIHYAQSHTNRCSSCQANLPSPHLLTLHIDENHNPLRLLRQERGEKTYACFLEDCEKMCVSPQKRRLHLIDKHAFPREYNFRVVDRGVDRMGSMLKEGRRRRISTGGDLELSLGHRRRASSLAQAVRGEGEPPADVQGKERAVAEAEIDDLDRSMSALQFVPASVTRRQGMKT
jgi:hypothetical protein